MAWLKEITQRIGPRGLSTLVATLLALPFEWGVLTGFYVWLSPFVMLNSVFVLKSVVWLNGLAFIVLIFIFLRKRWFCRTLCPLGWGCDLVSSCMGRTSFSVTKVPSIGKWLAVISLVSALMGIPLFVLLDPMSIFNGFFAVFSQKMTIVAIISLSGLPVLLTLHLLIPGIWCAKICPLGGLQDQLVEIKSMIRKNQVRKVTTKDGINRRRRVFLASGIGLAAGIVLPSFLLPKGKNYFCPPGSVSASLFSVLCLRCSSCIKACPTNILVQRNDSEDIVSWMVPEIHFDTGFCLEKCNLCSSVCPSGAITLFSPDAKAQLKIGLAKLEPENCLLTTNTECDRCKIACPYQAITIEAEKGSILMLPVVNLGKCVGCGACAVICPPVTIQMIPC